MKEVFKKTSYEQKLAELECSGSALAQPALAALGLAAGGYLAAVAARKWLFAAGLKKTEKLPRPVISVGNIEAGGTGKTPLVCLLAQLLQKAGVRPAVVSRGWRGTAKGPVNVVSGGEGVLLTAGEAGDEPYLMARLLPGVPVITGRRRAEPARAAIRLFGAEVVLLDDGFQHFALARDLDIVVVGDALARKNPRLLPRGLLREPLSALARADVLVLANSQGAGLARVLAECFPNKPRFHARHVPERLRGVWHQGGEAGAEWLAGRRVVAFCGIGGPERFRRMLQGLKAELVGFQAFPDHHAYRQEDLRALRAVAEEKRAILLTTEKDAARLSDYPPAGEFFWALGVRLVVEEEAELAALVLKAAGVRGNCGRED
ncbi:MAG: tetraacyldisaccharide 4'-kinase [Pseudomonadota bacterium]